MRMFLRCGNCGFEGDEEEFGSSGQCPFCFSHQVQCVNPVRVEKKPKVKEDMQCGQN